MYLLIPKRQTCEVLYRYQEKMGIIILIRRLWMKCSKKKNHNGMVKLINSLFCLELNIKIIFLSFTKYRIPCYTLLQVMQKPISKI